MTKQAVGSEKQAVENEAWRPATSVETGYERRELAAGMGKGYQP
jgi:hypothetical protein